MTVSEIAARLGGTVAVGATGADREVLGGVVSDLLSDVMANAQAGDLWVTLQRHVNIVAVAKFKELAGIVLVSGRRPEPETASRAEKERFPIVTTALPAFEVAGTLHEMGLRARRGAERTPSR